MSDSNNMTIERDSNALGEQITLLRIEVGKLMTKIDSFQQLNVKVDSLSSKVDATDVIARDAKQRAESAHHRQNGLTTVMMWAIGLGVTAVVGMIAFLSFLWNVIS